MQKLICQNLLNIQLSVDEIEQMFVIAFEEDI